MKGEKSYFKTNMETFVCFLGENSKLLMPKHTEKCTINEKENKVNMLLMSASFISNVEVTFLMP